MRMHWSRWGYTTACGKRLSGSRWLTRIRNDVTCKACRATVLWQRGAGR